MQIYILIISLGGNSKFVMFNFGSGLVVMWNLQMMQQQNANSGMRYMGGAGNRRNGIEASPPQGIMSLPLDASAVSHNASQNPQKPPLLPISKLTSALALANPDTHPQVCRLSCVPSSLIYSETCFRLNLLTICEMMTMTDAWGAAVPTSAPA